MIGPCRTVGPQTATQHSNKTQLLTVDLEARPLNIAPTMRALRLFALPVALLLLTAQCIPALWQMQCDDTGRTTTHWGTAKSCCMHEEPESEAPTIGKLCCTFSMVQATLGAQHRASVVQVPVQLVAIDAWLRPTLTLAYATEVPVRTLHVPPPRGATLDDLALWGVFRI